VSPSTYPQVHAGPVSGPSFEVMGSDPADDDVEPREPGNRQRRPIPWVRLAMAGVAAAALVVGGIGGAVWARHQEAQRHQAAERSAVAVSAVVTVGIVPSAPRKDGDSVQQRVDLGVVSAGPLPVDDVIVAWDSIHEAYSPANSGRTAVGTLAPHEPARVQLVLRLPCTTPALPGARAIPRLIVTARTQDGKRHQVVVDPLGLDQTWTKMAATCPQTDPSTLTTVALTAQRSIGSRGEEFTLTFTNPSAVDVLISGVILAKGFNTSEPQRPDPFQVFPNGSAPLVMRLTITSCRTAIQDVAPSTIRYVVASADDPSLQRPVNASSTAYAEAVGRLLSRVCVKN